MENEILQCLQDFTKDDCDRFVFIKEFLTENRLLFTILPLDKHRFFLVCPSGNEERKKTPAKKIFIAHYDRASGSPGANDNSAAVIALLFFFRDLAHKKMPPAVELLLTDSEEMPGDASPTAQGSFRLGEFLKARSLGRSVFFHFDMCGRGDIVIISDASERLLERRNKMKTLFYKKLKALRSVVLQRLSRQFQGRLVSLSTPFSDNLGFLLQGIPALQFTFLPSREAFTYRKNYKKLLEEISAIKRRSEEGDREIRKRFAEIQPLTWKLRHSERDTVDTLTDESFSIIRSLAESLVKIDLPLL